MNILIVGNLGYVGLALSKFLKLISIIVNCLFLTQTSLIKVMIRILTINFLRCKKF